MAHLYYHRNKENRELVPNNMIINNLIKIIF